MRGGKRKKGGTPKTSTIGGERQRELGQWAYDSSLLTNILLLLDFHKV